MSCHAKNISSPINIPRRNVNYFNDLEPEDKNEALSYVVQTAENVCNLQLKMQSNVVSFCGNPKRTGYEQLHLSKFNVEDIRGKKIFLPDNIKEITIETSNIEDNLPFVFAEITSLLIVHIECRISQLTITRCKNVNFRIKRAPIAGIECVLCDDIVIEGENCNFVRTTYSHRVNIEGECDENVIIDIRSSQNIYVNGHDFPDNVFANHSYSYSPDKKSWLPRSYVEARLPRVSVDDCNSKSY